MDQNESIPEKLLGQFWLVSAEMGYGHHRAVYPLKNLARKKIILNSNKTPEASSYETILWKRMLRTYEFLSRSATLPLLGTSIARLLNNLLYIPNFYPVTNRSKPTFQVYYLKYFLKKGLCKSLTEYIRHPELPLITSFYTTAIAADIAEHEKIYCIICDTDINRVWVAENPKESHIIYFASGTVAAQRLISYGVPEKNIVITGFPLPLELIGNRNLNILKDNLMLRLCNLDPKGIFYNLFKHSIRAYLDRDDEIDICHVSGTRSITITYAVGGAGAQKEIGRQIAHSLVSRIVTGEVKLNLVAGTRIELHDYFMEVKKDYTLSGGEINVIWAGDKETYFDLFNKCLNTTDILWTKPSELTFYCALGIPLVLSPAIGPQEKCNQKWIREIGAGFKQGNPENADQWLFDLINKGRMAEAAWNGFLKARKFGTFNIIDFLSMGSFMASNNPLNR